MENVSFGTGNSLFWDIFSQESVYSVTMKRAHQTVTYKVCLTYKDRQVTINTQDLLLNGETPDLMADQLAYQCGQPLYPLTIALTPHGKIHKILNYADIRTRWNTLKAQLRRYYSDSYSQAYLKQNHDFYNSEDLLTRRIQNTSFFFLYFGGIYGQTLGEELQREYIRKYKGVEYEFLDWVDAYTDAQGCFSIYREGREENRQEIIAMRYLLRNMDKNIEKAFFTFYKNGKAEQQLLLEQTEIKSVIMKGTAQQATKSTLNFWIDEKTETKN